MAIRKTILANNEIYHIYNRGVEKRPVFVDKKGYDRFMQIIDYYRFANCPIKFSKFKVLPLAEKVNLMKDLEKKSKLLVDIYAFCLMPNHFHFLLKQLEKNGISKFISKASNAFSHYFNIRHDRSGHLFQGNFGAVRIEDDEQLFHTSRYIHLNPVTSYIINLDKLTVYPYSSYPEYLGRYSGFTNVKEILSHFKNPKQYEKFVLDQADYSKQLSSLKRLTFE
jgi:putative transposase